MNRKMARKAGGRFDRLESRQLFVQMPSRSKQNWHDKSPLKKCGCQQKCPLKKCGCPQKYYVSLESPGRGCRHPGVFRSLSCFFRRAESSTGEALAFIPHTWYIVRVLKSTRHHTSLFFIALSLYSRGKDFCILLCFCQKYTGICKGRSLPKRAGTLPVGVPALFFISSAARKVVCAFSFFSFPFPPIFLLISISRSVCLLACLFGKATAFSSYFFSAWRKAVRAYSPLYLFHFSFKFLFYLSLFSAARKVCIPYAYSCFGTPRLFCLFLCYFLRLFILNVQTYLNGINTPFFIIFSFSFFVFLL